MPENTVIKVEGVYKDFKLPHQKANSIKSLFTGSYKKNAKDTSETQHALKDISFDIKEGEFFGIVGRNGSGKSTLLKILASIYQPTKGKVFTKGKLVPFIELGVGFNPELTGRENVYLNGALLGFTKKEIDGMYDEIVSFAELERFMDQKLKNYSSGMQVRLAFSVATRSEADILLIDEVLAVGDVAFQRKCFEYFKSLKKDKKTVVFVSHDMNAVREYCDRVALIQSSELIGLFDPESAANKYMQLFGSGRGGEEDTEKPKPKRWGDEKAVFKKPKVEIIDNDKTVQISLEISAKHAIEDPTYGLKISNEVEESILGTSTGIEKINVKPLAKGESTKIVWTLPNIFNEGKYSVELVLMYKSVTEVADWWENAVSFNVVNDKSTPYIVAPKIECKVG